MKTSLLLLLATVCLLSGCLLPSYSGTTNTSWQRFPGRTTKVKRSKEALNQSLWAAIEEESTLGARKRFPPVEAKRRQEHSHSLSAPQLAAAIQQNSILDLGKSSSQPLPLKQIRPQSNVFHRGW